MTKEIKYSYASALLVIPSDVSHTINFFKTTYNSTNLPINLRAPMVIHQIAISFTFLRLLLFFGVSDL